MGMALFYIVYACVVCTIMVLYLPIACGHEWSVLYEYLLLVLT